MKGPSRRSPRLRRRSQLPGTRPGPTPHRHPRHPLNQDATWPQGDPGVPYGGDPRFSCQNTFSQTGAKIANTGGHTTRHRTTGPTKSRVRRTKNENGEISSDWRTAGKGPFNPQAKCRSWAPQQAAEGYEAVASSREGARSRRPDSAVVNHQFSQPQMQKSHQKSARQKNTHAHKTKPCPKTERDKDDFSIIFEPRGRGRRPRTQNKTARPYRAAFTGLVIFMIMEI